MVIPGLALAAVGVVLVQQHGELAERRTEDQARLRAREASDSLRILLEDRIAAVDPNSSLRYPAGNGILNLGRLEGSAFEPPFANLPSTLSDRGFQRRLQQLNANPSPTAFREAAARAREPDQRAFLEIREAMAMGEPTDAALQHLRSGTRLADDFGYPLSLWAMDATGERDMGFAPVEWLNFGAIAFARDLGVDGYAAGEHELLAYVRDRYSAIEDWRMSPDSSWMVRRHGDAFLGVRVDSVQTLAAAIPGVHSLAVNEGAYPLIPTFPFLRAEIETDPEASTSLLWVLALGLVAIVITFGALNLFRDARRERRLSELRAGFVSSVSHEVRTPLTGIRLLTDSLLTYGPGSKDEWRQDLETISYEADRLTRMLDNVLRASRIERGTDRYHLTQGDLLAPVQKAVAAMRPALEEAGCVVETSLGTVDATFDADAVEQAVVNLLSNASKYAPGAQVAVTLEERDGEGVIVVADDGPGMPEDVRQNAFQPFFRGENGVARARTGSGLGLSLVRTIARGHGGEATMDPSGESGCRVTITIPIEP